MRSEVNAWDVLVYNKNRKGRTRHTQIGFAKKGNGEVINVKLEALPIPNEHGELWVTLVPYEHYADEDKLWENS